MDAWCNMYSRQVYRQVQGGSAMVRCVCIVILSLVLLSSLPLDANRIARESFQAHFESFEFSIPENKRVGLTQITWFWGYRETYTQGTSWLLQTRSLNTAI
jgi:hypothetical protein